MLLKQINNIPYYLAGLLLLILDIFTKLYMNNILQYPYNYIKINPIMNFTLIYNEGISFNLLDSHNMYIILGISILAVIIVTFLILDIVYYNNYLKKISLMLIITGSFANIFDRAKYGYVTDFIDIHYKNIHFPVFNLADIYISICVIIIAYNLFMVKKKGITNE